MDKSVDKRNRDIYSARPQLAEIAQVVKLVDTPASGVGGLTAVKVQVLSWAPHNKNPRYENSGGFCFWGHLQTASSRTQSCIYYLPVCRLINQNSYSRLYAFTKSAYAYRKTWAILPIQIGVLTTIQKILFSNLLLLSLQIFSINLPGVVFR